MAILKPETIAPVTQAPVVKAVETPANTKPAWESIEPKSLTPAQAELFTALTEANAFAKTCREALEKKLHADYDATLPPGKELIFSYKFGPSLAVVDKGAGRTKGGKGKKSISEAIAASVG